MDTQNKILKLNRFVKFRQEKNGILVCNCLTLETLLFPRKALCVLEKLKKGICLEHLNNKFSKNVLNDLITFGFISEDDTSKKNSILWNQVEHYEREFLKNN